MTCANLIGYSVGIDGTASILWKIVDEGGVKMLTLIFVIYWMVVHFMFEVREGEKRAAKGKQASEF